MKTVGLKSRSQRGEVKRWYERRFGRETSILEPPRIIHRRLRKSDRNTLTIMGVTGFLPTFLNKYPELQRDYEDNGWLGIIERLIIMVHEEEVGRVKNRQEVGSLVALHLAHECSIFWHLGWRIDRCTYGNHHDGYWYVRQPMGRPPEACPMHARAARQYRWENSPSRKRNGGWRREAQRR